ncbi:hypothetical protein ACIGCK_02425 [Microbacterium sp. NPDC078428]|uniref:hypothetical protein n=1 Tax=Microbacterium sp. NPDC078428 TaxID=3364190 RepID=UPI0037C71B91
MRGFHAVGVLGCIGVGVVTLSGCSTDVLIWGSDGARVIEVTDQLIGEVAADGRSVLVCANADVQLGTPADWEGRSAGEPERFTGQFWAEQVPLDPHWSINIEGLPEGASPGDQFPGDVFYRESGDGLCVIDVVWATLASRG